VAFGLFGFRMNKKTTPETDACWDSMDCNILMHSRNLEVQRDEARELALELMSATEAILPYIEGDKIAPWKPVVAVLAKAKEVLP
jgi:hypothetical protein